MTELWRNFEQARWFSGKGRQGRCTSITPLTWYGPAPGTGLVCVRSEIATVTYPDGSSEDYHLLISHRRAPLAEALLDGPDDPELGHPHDALRDPEALAIFVAAIASQDVTSTWSSVVRKSGRLSGPIRVFGGEQSNTSLMVGDASMVKLFRKLEHGHNLDIAVHDALGRAQVSSAAQLYGWVEATITPPGGSAFHADLAMVVEQLRDAKDGWDLALRAARDNTDFTGPAASLGTALAQIHQALADTFPAGRVDGADVATVMERRLHEAAAVAPALTPYVDGLTRLFEVVKGLQLNVQQSHGDFHLGQTLLTPGGWRIIDFEGEPMKKLAERQVPDSKWRDVAGMVRSLDYATSGAAEPGGTQATAWAASATHAFLNRYAPSITETQRAVLNAYIADRAIYEVVYEARNRPTWVDIPLRAVAQLTERN